MPVAPVPILSKQQLKSPTSMRYDRVQDILENDPAFRLRLSPKNHPVDTRFGEKVLFSKEVVEVTNTIHAEGHDAHKVSQNDVLRVAARVLRVIQGNGDSHTTIGLTPPPLSPKQPVKAALAAPPAAPLAPPPKKKKAKPVAIALPAPPAKVKAAKKKPPTKPTLLEARPARFNKLETPKATKPEPKPEPEPKAVSKPAARPSPPVLEEQVPESELPPEKQPLRLPRNFDPSKFPHYSVQTSIYGLLLSALNLAEHYERFTGMEARHKKLEDILKDYQQSCDALKLKTT